jgi:hypothetical protein
MLKKYKYNIFHIILNNIFYISVSLLLVFLLNSNQLATGLLIGIVILS